LKIGGQGLGVVQLGQEGEKGDPSQGTCLSIANSNPGVAYLLGNWPFPLNLQWLLHAPARKAKFLPKNGYTPRRISFNNAVLSRVIW
jgi:hypothetical protein